MKRHLTHLFALFLCCSAFCLAEELVLTGETQRLVTDITTVSEDPALWRERPNATYRALEKLAGKIDRETADAALRLEGESLSAKIVVIASNWRACESLSEELNKYYAQLRIPPEKTGEPERRQPLTHVDTTPQLRNEHVTQRYRLSWEAYVLMAKVRFEPVFFRDTVCDALARIGDPKSVIVLEYRLGKLCSDPKAETMPLIFALARLPSQQSLKALLASAELWDSLAPTRHATGNPPPLPGGLQPIPEPERDENIRKNVLQSFASLPNQYPEIVVQWLPLLKEFPHEKLKPETVQLLQEMGRALQKKNE